MRELKLRRTGALSNAGRIEALMRHMQYGDEKIQEVLATLSTRCKPQTDDWLEEAGLDKKVCEAELLSRLLEEKEVCEWSKKSASAGPKTTGDAADVNKKPQEPWPAHKACVDTGDEPDLPANCKIRHCTPLTASPYWRAELPAGETHLGKMTKSKSYIHSEGVGTAKVESAAARSTVVAWLWEWHEMKQRNAASKDVGSKKRQRS